jgi:hypothetical protein
LCEGLARTRQAGAAHWFTAPGAHPARHGALEKLVYALGYKFVSAFSALPLPPGD